MHLILYTNYILFFRFVKLFCNFGIKNTEAGIAVPPYLDQGYFILYSFI